MHENSSRVILFLLLLLWLSTDVLACNKDATDPETNADSVANGNGNKTSNQNAMANLSGVYSDTVVNGTVRFDQATPLAAVWLELEIGHSKLSVASNWFSS